MPKVAVAHTGDTFRTSKDGGLIIRTPFSAPLGTIFGTLGHNFTIFHRSYGLFFIRTLYGMYMGTIGGISYKHEAV